MYIVRVYKDINTGKELGAKLCDNGAVAFDIEWEKLRSLVKTGNIKVDNAYINSSNKLQLKNMNPKKHNVFYRQHYVDDLIINQYCIILSASNGKLTYMADKNDGVIYENNKTVYEIANALDVDIKDLKFYNGYIEKEDNAYNCFVFLNGRYVKIQPIINNKQYKLRNETWNMIVKCETQLGLHVEYLKTVNNIYCEQIPSNIYHLENFCGNVNKVIIPKTLKSLGEGCFESLPDLNEVTFEGDIETIPNYCFHDSKLKTLKIKGKIKEIGEEAFSQTRISDYLFLNVEVIGKGAFYDSCIRRLSLLNTKLIHKGAFEGCTKLTSVSFGDSLMYIGSRAFIDCNKLTEITLPKSLKKIDAKAFYYCTKLKVVKMYKSTLVADNAFPKHCKIIYLK